MIVQGTFQIKGRGTVITVILEQDEHRHPKNGPSLLGKTLRRPDGAEWTVTGVETHAKLGHPRKGDPAGLLLSDGAPIAAGDVVEVVS